MHVPVRATSIFSEFCDPVAGAKQNLALADPRVPDTGTVAPLTNRDDVTQLTKRVKSGGQESC